MEKLIWETAEEIDMKLAGRIRGIRKRRSISQKKLSEMSGAFSLFNIKVYVPPLLVSIKEGSSNRMSKSSTTASSLSLQLHAAREKTIIKTIPNKHSAIFFIFLCLKSRQILRILSVLDKY